MYSQLLPQSSEELDTLILTNIVLTQNNACVNNFGIIVKKTNVMARVLKARVSINPNGF